MAGVAGRDGWQGVMAMAGVVDGGRGGARWMARAAVIGGFVRGLSMRDIESRCEEAGLGKTSRSTVARICAELHQRLEAFKRRVLFEVKLSCCSST